MVITIHFCFPASGNYGTLALFQMWQNKSGHGCTRFKSLHCYWRGVIPETLKHFSKLTSPQLPQQLDGCTVNLPLVHSVVRQAVSLRDLHLQQQDRERERERDSHSSPTQEVKVESSVGSSPSCMLHPDMYTDHQSVWSSVPPAASTWERFCSSTQSSVHSPSSSACNASPSHCPALEESEQS